MLRLTVWMNIPSFYQNDLFKVLAATGEVDLEVVYAHQLPPERLSLGWSNEVAGYRAHFLDEKNPVRHAMRLAKERRGRFHIINGVWAEPAFAAAMTVLSISGSQYAIYSEAQSPDSSRSKLKRLVQKIWGPFVVKRARGLLPVSTLGEKYFKTLGAKTEQIYPFGYFRSRPDVPAPPSVDSETMELVYVGQLVPRKGVDVLFRAVAPLCEKYPALKVTLIGVGSGEGELRKLTEEMGLTDRVTFTGIVPSGEIPGFISRATAFVLPSRWDGWGLVVNEALSVGVPVFVSDRCGAADIIREGCNGFVFRNEDSAQLSRSLDEFLSRKENWPRFRKNSSEMGEAVSVEKIVPYLISSLRHMKGETSDRPRTPWDTVLAGWQSETN